MLKCHCSYLMSERSSSTDLLWLLLLKRLFCFDILFVKQMQTFLENQRCWYRHPWTVESETPVQGCKMVRHMWPPPELFQWTGYSNTWSTTQMTHLSHRCRNFVDLPLSIELDPEASCWFLFCSLFLHLGMQLETHMGRWHGWKHISPRMACWHTSRNAVQACKNL